MIPSLVLLAVFLLAYANGANDNFKGVASLYGSRTCGYRMALIWGTVTTAAGSIAACFLASALLKNFSGKGLVPDHLMTSPAFLLAIAAGAGGTVLLATRFGFPISTTHGLTGALTGAGLAAAPGLVNFGLLGKTFVIPLLLSPFLAVFTGGVLYLIFRKLRLVSGLEETSCLCAGAPRAALPADPGSGASLAFSVALPSVTIGTAADCGTPFAAPPARLEARRVLDTLHFLSAGAVSFARGLNDTPKIAALLLVVSPLSASLNIGCVALAMAAGGLLSARRVADTMSHKLTDMNPGQGFSANLSTALLVTTASLHGLPVSTTHVSTGSLLGMGAVTGQIKWHTVRPVLASWVITLPVATALAALTYLLIQSLPA